MKTVNTIKTEKLTIRPLFRCHEADNTQMMYFLCVTNQFKHIKIVQMVDTYLKSIKSFNQFLSAQGNFIFLGDNKRFNQLKKILQEKTLTCTVIDKLGWQKQGFWAWANGITTEKGFLKADKFGIIEFNNINYFIPANSLACPNYGAYNSDRKFIYKKGFENLDIRTWSMVFQQVFGENAKIAICFWVASLFRDFIVSVNKSFPILSLYGPAGTGKTQMAISMNYLFGEPQHIHNNYTIDDKYIFYLSQLFSNAYVCIDEYSDNSIDPQKIDALKSIYDAYGRAKITDKKTPEITSSMIISGQKITNINVDVSLFSKLILLQFYKRNYSKIDHLFFSILKAMEQNGISYFSSEIISHRAYFEEQFSNNMQCVIEDILGSQFGKHYDLGIMKNYCTLAAALLTITDKVDLGLNYSYIRDIFITKISLHTIELKKQTNCVNSTLIISGQEKPKPSL